MNSDMNIADDCPKINITIAYEFYVAFVLGGGK